MQRTLPILGLFAILFVGMISPAMAESDEHWEDTYHELEEEYNEQRYNLEQEFEDKYEELNRYYDEQKMEIYDKIDSDPSLGDDEVEKMFQELFDEYEQKQEDIDEVFEKELTDLNRMYDEKFNQLNREFEKDDYDKYNDDGTYYDDDDHYDDKYYDGQYHDDKNYDDRYYYDSNYYAPHEKDPEWDSIEPLAKRIMEIIPMDKIQRLWEAGQLDEIVELIVSETDLTYEEAKRVVMFFEKYENQKPDDHYYPKHDYPGTDYYEPYPVPGVDNGEILRLEQRISELEDENQMLRETIAELEEKLVQINGVVMEQVKFIYEWVLSQ